MAEVDSNGISQAQSREWELHPEFESSEGRIAANKLRRSLHTLGERFFLGKNLSESQWVWAQCVALSRGLCGGDAERYAPKLAFSLHTHGMSLQALGRMAEACHAKEEAITLVETLCGGIQSDTALF